MLPLAHQHPTSAAYLSSASIPAVISSTFLFFCLRFFSPRAQRWQKGHFNPKLQPLFLCKNAHGLHSPEPWPTEPMLGRRAAVSSARNSAVAAPKESAVLQSDRQSGSSEPPSWPCAWQRRSKLLSGTKSPGQERQLRSSGRRPAKSPHTGLKSRKVFFTGSAGKGSASADDMAVSDSSDREQRIQLSLGS